MRHDGSQLQLAACFLNRNSALCRQGIQSFVDGGEHLRRFFRRFVQPMTECLLLSRIESKDGFLNFRELRHSGKRWRSILAGQLESGVSPSRSAGLLTKATKVARPRILCTLRVLSALRETHHLPPTSSQLFYSV